MTDAVYMDLLPTWWSREWAQERLGAFTESELERGRLLLLSGCFTEVSADGSRPVYFFGEKTSTKLRSERYSENDRQRIIGIIQRNQRWCEDLRKGVMSEELWETLSSSRLSPELTYDDDLSTTSKAPRINKAEYSAAGLLCAAWLISCDPALMFAWRGLNLYGKLQIPSLPVKPLSLGRRPARSIILPAAQESGAAGSSAAGGDKERGAVLNRWASLPLTLAWLKKLLPGRGDLSAADELAPKLTGLKADIRSDGTTISAVLPLADGSGKTVSLSMEVFDYWTRNRLGNYFTNRDEECVSLAKNLLSPEFGVALDRMCGGRLQGGNGTRPCDTLLESSEPAAQALALRVAAAMSKYPRLMLYWRGFDLLSYARYHERVASDQTDYGTGRRRRYGIYDGKPVGIAGGTGFLSDLRTPDDNAAEAPDLPGSAPWAESWIGSFDLMGYDDVAGAAQAALREGRVSDIAPDPENGRLLCEVADELGGKQTVSLPFAAWSEKERGLAAALLYLNPAQLTELRDGVISADLQSLLDRYSLRLLPEAYDGSYRGNEEARRTPFKARVLAALIRVTQALSADPLLLLRWRGFDVSDGSLFEKDRISPATLLEVCAPGSRARDFIGLFVQDVNSAPVADAARLISEEVIGAPAWDAKGGVKVICRTDSGRKNLLLHLKPFTCREAAEITDFLDRRYSVFQSIAERKIPEALEELISGMGAGLTGGELLLKNEDVGANATSDPLILAVILKLAAEIGRDPALLFAWRGLPLGSVPLGQIRTELAGKSPDEPFIIAPPKKADRYLQKTVSRFEKELKNDTVWWGRSWLDEDRENDNEYSFRNIIVSRPRPVDVSGLTLSFLPNLQLLSCTVTDGKEKRQLLLHMHDLDAGEKEQILKFFEKRPALAKALGQGYLDRSFGEFARSKRISILGTSHEDYIYRDGSGSSMSDDYGVFARLLKREVVKDPTLMFLWRGLDIRRKLRLGGTPAPLQEPDAEALRALDAALKETKSGKGAAAGGSSGGFIMRSFGRRLIAGLAEDAVTGYLRDAKASRIREASFSSESGKTELSVWHGTTSYDRASLSLDPFTDWEKETVLTELRNDPHALSLLQVGKLDEEFVRRLQSLGIPLMCGESTGDRMGCTCRYSFGVVCRHEIALLRRTAQLIESDPALLFAMRGLDIRAELKKLGAESGSSAWMRPEALLTIHPELNADDTEDATPEDVLHHLNRVSFAKVPAGLLGSAMRLLAASPSGCVIADCKAEVSKALDEARECAKEMIRSDLEISALPDFTRSPAIISGGSVIDGGSPSPCTLFNITRETDDTWAREYVLERSGFASVGSETAIPENIHAEYRGMAFIPRRDWSNFEEMHSLPAGCFNGRITAEVLDKAGTAAQAMYALCSVARKLVLAGAVMPCPIRSDEGKLSVIWIPCLMAHEVLTLTARIGMLARKLLLGKAIIPGSALGVKAEELSDAGFGALSLGMFISDLVRKGFVRHVGRSQAAWNRISSETPELILLMMGFWGSPDIAAAPLKRIERSVGQWLAPLFLGLTGMRPVIILGTSAGPDPEIPDAEERLRKGGEEAILDKEKSEDAESPEKEEVPEDAEVEDDVSAEISLGFIDRDDGRYISYAEVPGLDAGKRGECRAAAARISALLPEAAEIISGRSEHAVLPLEALQKALFEILPALKLSGALVVLPREMRRILRPMAMASLGLQKGYKGGSGLMSLTSLLTFDWKATLGGQEITEEQFAELRKHAGHLVRFGNDYVYASASEIDAILRRLSGKTQRPSRLRLLEAALSGTYEGNEVFMDEKIRKAINKELKTPPAKVPEGLNAELRPYQERGYSWLMHNIRARMGSIIADDMGLGKTVQVIAALEALRAAGELEKRQALIAVPASVVINWTRELRRFAPELSVNVYYGTQRSLEPQTHVLLTTYGTLRQDIEKLKDKKWRVAVADEAQNIKNPGSQIFQDMCLLQTDSSIAMSGTPVENRLADYWAIMEFVNPGLFGTLGSFTSDYAQPIERNRDADAVKRLRSVTAPFILRRLKTDKSVIADLPDKISSDRFCELTPEQAAMYQEFVSDGLEGVTETLSQLERSARVLKLILRLKQICDAPELFSKDPKITGPSHSGKAGMLLDLLGELIENGQKAIVFTQFREMGDLLVSWIGEKLGTVPDFIHGGVSVKKRQEMVDRFQNDPESRVMVLSLKAAGTGLNLTAASAVIHYDLWWNPAVEDQATDRAYRIGQNKNVMVYRFICAGTFEEKINEIINSKKEIAELTVQKGEKWLGDLSKSELRSFLSMSQG